jgi:hypothetical protein
MHRETIVDRELEAGLPGSNLVQTLVATHVVLMA